MKSPPARWTMYRNQNDDKVPPDNAENKDDQ